ncbi:MAG: Ig-like domain-containing protein, partial [Bacteroidales bacterium]
VVSMPPYVEFTSPPNDTAVDKGEPVNLELTASDTDNGVDEIILYEQNTVLDTLAASPYTYTYSKTTAGDYPIVAKVVDSAGAVSFDTMNIRVKMDAPVAIDTIPEDGATNVSIGRKTVSVSFDQSLDSVDFSSVSMSPSPAGLTTQLLDTTVQMSFDTLMPSTTYTVDVPAGVAENADGKALPAVSWSFTTEGPVGMTNTVTVSDPVVINPNPATNMVRIKTTEGSQLISACAKTHNSL